MKYYKFLLLTVFMLTGCEQLPPQDYIRTKEIMHDGCQYVLFTTGSTMNYYQAIHKPNCTNHKGN